MLLSIVLCAAGVIHGAPLPQQQLPDVVGLTVIEAKAKLEGAGFQVKVFDASYSPLSGPLPETAVVKAMEPAPSFAESSFAAGTEVSLAVIELVPVPHLVGEQVKDAIITCNEVGLLLVVGGTRPSSSDTRVICAHGSPAPGTYVAPGTIVNVMVVCPGGESAATAAFFGALIGAVVGGLIGAFVARRSAK
jgi:beta-lactam-binding protein with PASTA domain